MNIAVAQSGGPTCAINASLLGVVNEAAKSDKIETVYGSVNGILGIINNELVNLSEEFEREDAALLRQTPSTVLGSCRFKLPSKEENCELYENIVKRFEEYNIGAFFYIGGNDSMDTTAKLSAYMKETGKDIKIIGIPKTIDNDLCVTDHTPGFGSAAKYLVTTLSEIARDSMVYSKPCVTVIEVMGRNAGWLAASACALKANGGCVPHLIYLPECEFSTDKFINDINEQLKNHTSVIAVVSEGVDAGAGEDANYKVDAFGHGKAASVGKYLEKVVADRIGCKVRSIELNVMQRCSSHLCSLTDINEAEEIGAAGVKAMLNGETGKMMCFKRISDEPYRIAIEAADASLVANHEKLFPKEWINSQENNVKPEALKYFLPLILGEAEIKTQNGIPVHFKAYNK